MNSHQDEATHQQEGMFKMMDENVVVVFFAFFDTLLVRMAGHFSKNSPNFVIFASSPPALRLRAPLLNNRGGMERRQSRPDASPHGHCSTTSHPVQQ
jgi:hypothetical protein